MTDLKQICENFRVTWLVPRIRLGHEEIRTDLDALEAFALAVRREALIEAIALLDADTEIVLNDWSEDAEIPKGEHSPENCKDRCDAYCLLHLTFTGLAHKLQKQLNQAQGGDDGVE